MYFPTIRTLIIDCCHCAVLYALEKHLVFMATKGSFDITQKTFDSLKQAFLCHNFFLLFFSVSGLFEFSFGVTHRRLSA